MGTSGRLLGAFTAPFALFPYSLSLFLPPLAEFSLIFMIWEPSDTKKPPKINEKPRKTTSCLIIFHDSHFSTFIDFGVILARILT